LNVNDLTKLIKQAMLAADGGIERAAATVTEFLCSGMVSPHAKDITRLVNEALKARIAAEHGADRNIILNNARDPSNPVSLVTRRPIPIAGRRSNSELQNEIDATLDIRILGDTKLRDATRTDLFRSAEQDEKTAKTRVANAVWKRELGRQLKPGKTVGQCGFTGLAIRKIIRGHGGNLSVAA
jgi:hypothetical protein